MKRPFVMLLLVLFVAAVCSKGSEAAVYVSGQVFRKTIHIPVPGATVTLISRGTEGGEGPPVVAVTQTLQNGSFLLKVRAAGKYSLSVEAPNYLPFGEPLTLSSSGFRLVDVPLVKQPTLQLKIIPVPGQTLAAGPLRARLWIAWKQWDARVDSQDGAMTPDGDVELSWPPDILPKDVWKLLIEVESERNGCGEIQLNGWHEEPQKMVLQPGRVLSGQVFDRDGKPTASAMAYLVWMLPNGLPYFGPEEPEMIPIGPDGHFSVPSLFPKPYLVLTFSGQGRNAMQMPRADFHVVTPGDAEVKFKLSRHGIVTFMRNNPFMDAFRAGAPPVTDAFRAGAPPVQVLERVDPSGARWLPLISGRVIDQKTGAPIKGAALRLRPVGEYDPVDIAASADDGTYRLRAIPNKPVKYSLIASAGDYVETEQTVEVPTACLTAMDLVLARRPKLLVKPVDARGTSIIDSDLQTWMLTIRNSVWSESQVEEPPDFRDDGTIEIIEPRADPAGALLYGPIQDMLIAVRSEKHGYGEMRFQKWPDGPVTLPLQPAATLGCLVVDAAGKPVPSTYVTIKRSVGAPDAAIVQKLPAGKPTEGASGRHPPIVPAPSEPAPVLAARVIVSLKTDAAGRFEVSSLPSGQYEIMCYSAGQQYSTSVTLTTGKTEMTLHPLQEPPATVRIQPRPKITIQRHPAVKQ